MAIRKIVKELFTAIEESNPLTVARILDSEPELSYAEYKKNLPISLAVKNGNAEITARILESLIRVDETQLKKSIEAAVRSIVFRKRIELLPLIMETVKERKDDPFPSDCDLVDEAIDLGRPANFIRTLLDESIPYKLPLHAAAGRGTPAVLRLLLERNIGDPSQVDQWGNMPMDIARERRNNEGPKVGQKLIELLQEHSGKRSNDDLPWGHHSDGFIYFELLSPRVVVCDPGMFEFSMASKHTLDDFVPGIYRINIDSIRPAENGENAVSVDFGCLVFVDADRIEKLKDTFRWDRYADKHGHINWSYFDSVAAKIGSRFGFCSGGKDSPFQGDGLYTIDFSSIHLFSDQ